MPLAEHDRVNRRVSVSAEVSIHVPLAEHDQCFHCLSADAGRFNSRAPRGARPLEKVLTGYDREFQFTCPSRSTTCVCYGRKIEKYCFNSRAPRGARRGLMSTRCTSQSFNSRAPRGARPPVSCIETLMTCVSIHVPLAEHDEAIPLSMVS